MNLQKVHLNYLKERDIFLPVIFLGVDEEVETAVDGQHEVGGCAHHEDWLRAAHIQLI